MAKKATGNYPRGKLNAEDLGGTQMAVGVQNNTVIIAFPKPMDWIGLGYDDAVHLANLLLKRAEEIKQ